MSEKTIKFNNIRLNKKEFLKSKEPIDLMSVDVDQIVVSEYLTNLSEIKEYQRKRYQKLVQYKKEALKNK